MRVISYGGGVQSTALVVLAAQGRIDADVALFANTGHDSEHPATLDYVHDVATPWAAAHGLPIVEVAHPGRTLYREIIDAGNDVIPVWLQPANVPATRRACTKHWKVLAVRRWLREQGHGTTLPAADLMLGISVDEIERAKALVDDTTRRCFPLLDLGLSRGDCAAVIADAGLPVPPKSACWFCPYRAGRDWARMARDEPDLFAAAVQLEDTINARRAAAGKSPAYLSRYGRLSDGVTAEQPSLPFGDGTCDEGVCGV